MCLQVTDWHKYANEIGTYSMLLTSQSPPSSRSIWNPLQALPQTDTKPMSDCINSCFFLGIFATPTILPKLRLSTEWGRLAAHRVATSRSTNSLPGHPMALPEFSTCLKSFCWHFRSLASQDCRTLGETLQVFSAWLSADSRQTFEQWQFAAGCVCSAQGSQLACTPKSLLQVSRVCSSPMFLLHERQHYFSHIPDTLFLKNGYQSGIMFTNALPRSQCPQGVNFSAPVSISNSTDCGDGETHYMTPCHTCDVFAAMTPKGQTFIMRQWLGAQEGNIKIVYFMGFLGTANYLFWLT